MDGPLKELAKLEKLTAVKGTGQAISDWLDSLISSLQDSKNSITESDIDEEILLQLSRSIESTKKDIDDRQKEVYSSVSRLGKALDKVTCLCIQTNSKLNHTSKKFPASLPTYPRLFESLPSRKALERTIALHFLRTGQLDTAEIFLDVRRNTQTCITFSDVHP